MATTGGDGGDGARYSITGIHRYVMLVVAVVECQWDLQVLDGGYGGLGGGGAMVQIINTMEQQERQELVVVVVAVGFR